MMSLHLAMPRKGHLDQVLHIFAYLGKYHSTGLPNVGLGLVLLPLGYGVGLLILTFLLCSMIICLVLSESVSQML